MGSLHENETECIELPMARSSRLGDPSRVHICGRGLVTKRKVDCGCICRLRAGPLARFGHYEDSSDSACNEVDFSVGSAQTVGEIGDFVWAFCKPKGESWVNCFKFGGGR